MNVNVFESFSDSSVYRILSRCLARLLHGLSSCKHCGILKIFELLYIFFYFLPWYFTLHLFWLYLCAPEYYTLCMELFRHMQHTTSTCYTNFMVSLRLASHLILFNLMTSFSPWVSPLTYIHGMDNHLKITNMFVLSLYIIITYLQHTCMWGALSKWGACSA